MQTCLECGLVMEDHEFPDHDCEIAMEARSTPVVAGSSRPDGDGLMSSGGWLMAIGVAIAVIAGIAVSNAGDGAYTDYALMQAAQDALFYANVAWFGSGLFSVGLLIWLTGNIVKAISFLPAKVHE